MFMKLASICLCLTMNTFHLKEYLISLSLDSEDVFIWRIKDIAPAPLPLFVVHKQIIYNTFTWYSSTIFTLQQVPL